MKQSLSLFSAVFLLLLKHGDALLDATIVIDDPLLDTTCPSNMQVTNLQNETVKFLCYNADTKDYNEVFLNDNYTQLSQKINMSKKVSFVIHGWQAKGSDLYLQAVALAWVDYDESNVCVVDWGSSSTFNYECQEVYRRVFNVGYYLKLLIDLLVTNGYNSSDISMAGHSLGAHIAGITGKLLNGLIKIIYGLDPAGLCYYSPRITSTKCRLDPTDSQFVQVTHSSVLPTGSSNIQGHQDFFPNGGSLQPPCSDPNTMAQYNLSPPGCNHFMAVFIFLQSLNKTSNCKGTQCSSYGTYTTHSCDNNTQDYIGPRTNKIPNQSNQYYYFQTPVKAPYC